MFFGGGLSYDNWPSSGTIVGGPFLLTAVGIIHKEVFAPYKAVYGDVVDPEKAAYVSYTYRKISVRA